MDQCCICQKEAGNTVEIDTKKVAEELPLITKIRDLWDDHFWYFWDYVSALLPDGGVPLHQIGRMKELGLLKNRL